MKRKMGRIDAGQHESEVYAFLRDYMLASQGRAPTTREIQTGVKLRSLRVVQQTLGDLEKRGLIARGGFGRARTIRLVKARYVLLDDEGDAGGPSNGGSL